jgi:putative transcriptional regulator
MALGGRRTMPLRILCAIAFLVPTLCAGDGPDLSHPVFLVAHAKDFDPNFRDTVVLLTRHDAIGTTGLIINRPTSIPLGTALPEFQGAAPPDSKVSFGGPVSPQTVVFLSRLQSPAPDAAEILPGVYASSARKLLRELLRGERSMTGLRVFSGYAGWDPGQLEMEIRRGDWRVVPAEAKWIFDEKPDKIWPELDRRASATMVSNDVR